MKRAAKKTPARKASVRKAKPRKDAASKALATYNAKRDFSRTPEPSGESATGTGNSFMVQHHWARRDHYDFRLELDGVLKSWAVTKGPSANPRTKRLAVRTEDHPLSYATFEGTIPQGEYGGGTVMLWDRGTWKSLDTDPAKAIEKGSLKFALEGERMKGEWALVRLKGEGKRENWLLIKHRDDHAENDDGLVERYTDSVSTGRSKSGIEKGEAPKRAPDAPRKKSAGWHKFIPPQLCETRAEPPEGKNWIYEIKYDGYRLQVHVQGGEARVMTRNGLDWSAKFPAIVNAAKRLNVSSAILDGEAVVFDARGISDFPALVASLEHGRSQAVLQAFDLLEIDGEDIRKLPLLERKSRLEEALKRSGTAVRYSGHLSGPGKTVFEKAVAGGAEGIIAKVADGKYVSGRSSGWVKIKDDKRQDVYIVGWTKSDRNRPFASLMTASERSGELVFSGGVGTGFSMAKQKDILAALEPLELKKPPDSLIHAELAPKGVVWTKPSYEAEVALTGFTEAGLMRHPRFIEMKEATHAPAKSRARASSRSADKAASNGSAVSKPGPKRAAAKSSTETDEGKLTHPERLIYPAVGVTKQEVADYYAAMCKRMAPFLDKRPLSVVRAPDGVESELFFQRHPMKGMERGVIPVRDSGKIYFALDGKEGLQTAAQFSMLELHGWGVTTDDLERPDRLVMDLDPDPSVPFKRVVALAEQVRDILKAAGLKSFPLVSGGKGLHVVVPLDASAKWDVVSAFAERLAKKMAEADPKSLIATATLAKRKGRIFIDYLRNKKKATAIMPYSLRAKPNASIAMPVEWSDLATLKSADQFKMKDGLKAKAAWRGYEKARGRITKAMVDALK